jgi:mediator of RNA polymerase II transcription subunit 18
MSQPVTSAFDSLTAALKSNIIPNQEYLLQGSVLDSAVEVLLHRLRGLCDNVDSGPETFHDHEMCFSIRKYPHTKCVTLHAWKYIEEPSLW